MYKQFKSYLKRYHSLVTLYETVHKVKYDTINNMRDIRDSYLLKGRKAEETPYGFKLQGSSSIHHRSMQKGTFEVEETALIRQYLSRSDVFIDVGANIGFYTCLARSLGKQVIAVEPLRINQKYLYANLIDNKWHDVEVFPVGLSDHPGIAMLYGPSSTGASLIGNWAGASKGFKRVISLSTLDILLGHRLNGKRIFIKIDVEGVEYQVLMGAIRTMKLIPQPIWLIEICLSEFHPNGINPNYAATFEMFWENGYEVRTADEHNRLIQPSDIQRWVKAGHCDSGVINYIFIPKSD
ncbi:MAG TPA: FkbM family methyltransferase [Nitrospirota bacterium]|nr:FkbM family methyltransferase [Nitrospirota bacterium]